MTYLAISAPFLLAAAAVWWINRHACRHQVAVTTVVLVALLTLTTIFDNLMIRAGLVGYSEHANSGIAIGVMPIEDLTYPVAAALIVTALWRGKGTRR